MLQNVRNQRFSLEDVGRRCGRRVPLARISLEDVDPLFKVIQINQFLKRISVFQGNAREGHTSSTTSSHVFHGKQMVVSHFTISTHVPKHVCHVRVSRPYFSATPVHDEWLKPNIQSMTATQCLDVAKVSAKRLHGEPALSPWRCDHHRP